MDWRMRLFSYLFAVFFGVLLAQFLFSGDEPPASPRIAPEGAPSEVIELRARLQSEQALRRQLESRIARLQAEKPPVAHGNSPDPAPTEVEVVTDSADEVPVSNDPSADTTATESQTPPLTYAELLTSGNFSSIFQAIIDQVSRGEVEPAIQDLQRLEAALASLPDGGPFAGLEPIAEGVMSYWVPQVMASCKGAGEEWLRLFIRAREMEWQGVERGPLLDLFSVDEFLALAVYSIETVNESAEKLLLDHMTESFVSKGYLSDQELAALSLLPGEAVVGFLEQVWKDSSANRDSVLAALTQAPHPSARAFLRGILPQLEDLKLRSALEIWLNR
ncbi:MAG: hypothetical protein H2076_10295 [Planctomycetes bacterium]|nr:hypothetical protein [Planctomycetota bacterium]